MLSRDAATGYGYNDVHKKGKRPIAKNSKPIRKRILVVDVIRFVKANRQSGSKRNFVESEIM
jgi:hypothetical protein